MVLFSLSEMLPKIENIVIVANSIIANRGCWIEIPYKFIIIF